MGRRQDVSSDSDEHGRMAATKPDSLSNNRWASSPRTENPQRSAMLKARIKADIFGEIAFI